MRNTATACQNSKLLLYFIIQLLEIQLDAELELARVEGGRRAAEIASVAVALVKSGDATEAGIGGGFVKRLNRLKPSAISSRRSRSPKRTLRVTRMSNEA